jgi:hypothetical protein
VSPRTFSSQELLEKLAEIIQKARGDRRLSNAERDDLAECVENARQIVDDLRVFEDEFAAMRELSDVLPKAIGALRRVADKPSILKALDGDREWRERVVDGLERIERALPPPPPARKGPKTKTNDLRALVSYLASTWKRLTGTRFAPFPGHGKYRHLPANLAAGFVYLVVEGLCPERTTQLNKVLERPVPKPSRPKPRRPRP